ncbi:uncharacterized protein LOC119171923 [Rhipicephalus microplus]|uniref:uncharacterized protein LOC119171923 n=1 Tax=Rhipicephalus microplus TaxID=6941 RepID=UPI003F6BC0DC
MRNTQQHRTYMRSAAAVLTSPLWNKSCELLTFRAQNEACGGYDCDHSYSWLGARPRSSWQES